MKGIRISKMSIFIRKLELFTDLLQKPAEESKDYLTNFNT